MIHTDISKQIRSVMRDIGEPVVRIGATGVEVSPLGEGIDSLIAALETGHFQTDNVTSINDLVLRVLEKNLTTPTFTSHIATPQTGYIRNAFYRRCCRWSDSKPHKI